MNRRRVGTAAVIVAAVGVTGIAVLGVIPGKAPAEQYLTATVLRGEVVREAVADGTVQTTATYGLAFGRSPQLVVSGSTAAAIAAPSVLSWHVLDVLPTPGQEVSAGTVLALADTGLAQQQLITAQANLAAATARLALDKAGLSAADRAAAFGAVREAQAQLAQAQVSLSSTESQNSLAVEQAQRALARANQTYADDVTAGAPQEVRDADQRAITAAQDALDTATARSTAATSSAQSTVANARLGLSAAQQALSDTQSQNNTALMQAQGAYNSALQALLALQADSSSGTEAIAAAQAAVESAAATIQTAQARANATNNAAQAQVTAAQAQLDQAQQAAGTSGSQNDLAVAQAQAALSRAQRQLSDDLAKGAPKAVLDADQNAVTAASDGLSTTRARAAAANEAARAQLRSASAGLAAARDAYASRVAPAPAAQIDADLAQVAAARQSVMTAQEVVTNGILVAPVDGTVVAVNLEPGVDAPAGYGILLQSHQLRVVADFAETDKPALSLGLPASVEITPLHVTVDGTVSEISPVASGPGVGQSVVTYEVVIDLPNPPAGTAVGMSAHAAISTSRATDVLVVPSIAVQGSQGHYTVRVLDAQGKPAAMPVVVGLASQSVTEIKSGLSEGQTVIVGTTSDRTRVNFSGGGGFGAPTESPPAGSGSAP